MPIILLTGREADLGHGLTVRRLLPAGSRRRSVGPFVFFDHAGPVTLAPEDIQGADVRPHPHIGLATVSYMLGGEIVHRDSLGTFQRIRPGAVNWMTAGRGITHSERFEHPVSFAGGGLELLQMWVALPEDQEECEPAFEHTPESAAADLLTRSGLGFTVPVDDEDGIIAALEKIARGDWKPQPDDSVIAPFNARQQVAELAAIFNEALCLRQK